VDGGKHKVTFQKVLYTPELAKNLLSMAHITSKGCQLTINLQGCCIYNWQSCMILHAKAQGNMLILPIKPNVPSQQVNTVHQLPTLNELDIEVVDLLVSDCKVWKQGKQTHKPIQSNLAQPPEWLHHLSVYTLTSVAPSWSPLERASISLSASLMTTAGMQQSTFCAIKVRCSPHFCIISPPHPLEGSAGGYKWIKVVSILGLSSSSSCMEQGIVHKKVAPHTPEHNGAAE
jgi:hypothetical protein